MTAHVDISTLVTANQVNTIHAIWPGSEGILSIGHGLEKCGSFTFSDLLKIISNLEIC